MVRRLRQSSSIAGLALIIGVAWTTATPSDSQTVATAVQEQPVAMPLTWTQFRLNPAHNPVIDAPVAASWHIETHGQISASPTVAHGVVYVGTNGGSLYAIDEASGAVRWTYRGGNGFKSNPLVYGGLVIVGEGNADSTTFESRKRVRVGSGSSGLVAIDAETGRRRWYYPLTGTGQPTSTIVDGVLFHHDGDGMLVALDPRTGKQIFSRNVHAVASMVGAVPVDGGLIVTSGIFPNRVMAIRRSSGDVAWTYELPKESSGLGDCPPASDGRWIFCDYLAPVAKGPPVDPGVNAQERAFALDTRTGKKVWDVALEPGMVPPRNESAIPLLYRGRLYLGSAVAPYMHAIDPRTGQVLWSKQVHGTVKGGLVAHKGIVYFGDLSGYLWAIDSGSGRVIGSRNTGTSYNVGSPIIVGGSLIIGSNSGRVSATPLTAIAWSQDA
jgi:outer membrane protein assembly factor BamB